MDMAAIAGAASALKTAIDIGKELLSLRDTSAIQAKVREMQAEISSALASAITAQTDQLAMLERVRDLEQEIVRMKNWETEKKRYELKDLGTGAFAYVVKPDMENGEPVHCLCTKCYGDGFARHMQNTGEFAPNRHGRIWVCSDGGCGNKIAVRTWPPGFDPLANLRAPQ